MTANRLVWIRNGATIALCLLLFAVASMAAERSDVIRGRAAGTFDVKIAP